jgi:hypothetical protein
LASSMVEAFRLSRETREEDAARTVLLGFPAKSALARLLRPGEAGVDLLVKYIASESTLSAKDAGMRAEKLSITFERWATLKERRRLEQGVLQLRGHIVAAILGAVMAFLSTLAPFVLSFQFLAGTSAPPDSLVVYAGFAMTVVSSAYLGSFFSNRRRYLDPIIAAVAFLVSVELTAPIANVPPPNLWAIK